MKFFAVLAFIGLIAASIAAPQGIGVDLAGVAAGTFAGLGGAIVGKLGLKMKKSMF